MSKHAKIGDFIIFRPDYNSISTFKDNKELIKLWGLGPFRICNIYTEMGDEYFDATTIGGGWTPERFKLLPKNKLTKLFYF